MNIVEYLGDGQFILGLPGECLRISSLAVIDKSSGSPVWWLVDDRVSDESWEVAELQVTKIVRIDKEAYAVPKESNSGRELREVKLGRVPRGFRQVVPDSGSPPVVVPGREYILVITGSQWGGAEFVI